MTTARTIGVFAVIIIVAIILYLRFRPTTAWAQLKGYRRQNFLWDALRSGWNHREWWGVAILIGIVLAALIYGSYRFASSNIVVPSSAAPPSSNAGAAGSAEGIDTKTFAALVAASVAFAALCVAAIANFRQTRQSDVTAWDACHKRIGELYDMAIKERAIYDVLAQSIDPENDHGGKIDRPVWSVRQWITNYLMAIEQSVIAVEFMRPRSRRAWFHYLHQQFQKPTFRAEFVEDAFAYGVEGWSADIVRAMLQSIHPDVVTGWKPTLKKRSTKLHDFLREALGYRTEVTVMADAISGLASRPLTIDDEAKYGDTLRKLYEREEVQQQMIPLPTEWKRIIASRFVIEKTDDTGVVFVGCFVVEPTPEGYAEVGIALLPEWRKHGEKRVHGIAEFAMREALREATKHTQTVRATVFDDNMAGRRLMERVGFRRFGWYERSLPDAVLNEPWYGMHGPYIDSH